MITFALVVGCVADEPEPEPAEWFAPVQTWSDGPASRDQHHATVAVLDDADDRAVVGWTDGEQWTDPRARLRWISRTGVPGRVHDLADGGVASKPDVVLDGEAVLAGLQTPGAIEVERVEGDVVARGVVAGVPALDDNNSVDLAVWPDGRVVVVWYEADGEVGTYHAATVGRDLAPTDGLATLVASTDHDTAVSPDVDLSPTGHVAIAWVDQPFDGPTTLWLDAWSDDGALDWRTELAATEGEQSPRRATVVAQHDGTFGVGWRSRAETTPIPSTSWLGTVDADGALTSAVALDGDNDEIVIAPGGDGAVWAVWVAVANATFGCGVVWGGVWSTDEHDWRVAPVQLSEDACARRPHTDTRVTDEGLVCAVSWERRTRGGLTIRGRVGTIPLP